MSKSTERTNLCSTERERVLVRIGRELQTSLGTRGWAGLGPQSAAGGCSALMQAHDNRTALILVDTAEPDFNTTSNHGKYREKMR